VQPGQIAVTREGERHGGTGLPNRQHESFFIKFATPLIAEGFLGLPPALAPQVVAAMNRLPHLFAGSRRAASFFLRQRRK
jgi:hypothetical protein